MINIDLYTLIYKPIGLVFDFVSTPENDFQWQYGTLETSRLAKGLSLAGTFFRSIGHLMGRRNLSTFEVTEYEPNSKFGFKSIAGPLRTHTSYTFARTNDVTKVIMSTQANVIDFFHMDEGKLEKNLRKQGQENLASLKEILEAM